MRGDLERVLFDEPAIHRRLDDIAAQISNDYRELDLTCSGRRVACKSNANKGLLFARFFNWIVACLRMIRSLH